MIKLKKAKKKFSRLFFLDSAVPICSEKILICSDLFPNCYKINKKIKYAITHSNGAPVRGAVFYFIYIGGETWNTVN